MGLFWALYYFFWLKVLISFDARRQTFTVAELSPGPALCRTTLTTGKPQCACWILTSLKWLYILLGTICFLVCTAPTCLLLLGRDAQALLRWRLLSIPRCQLLGAPVVPSLMSLIHVARIWKQKKPFCRNTNDKKRWFWGASKLPCGASSLWKPVKVLFLHTQKIFCEV